MLRPFGGKESTAVASLTEALMHLAVLALPRRTGLYIVDTVAFDEQIECILLQIRKTEVRALLADGAEHWMIRNRGCPQLKKVPDGWKGNNTSALLFERSLVHPQEGPWRALADPYHARRHWKKSRLATLIVRLRIIHCPPRRGKT